jgi:hypothetical protein
MQKRGCGCGKNDLWPKAQPDTRSACCAPASPVQLGEYLRMQKWGYDWEKRMYKAWLEWSGLSKEEASRGMQPAIEEFLEGHKGEWRLLRRYTNNNGLTVLERVSGGPT